MEKWLSLTADLSYFSSQLIDFYDTMAMNGDVRSAYALARLFSTGSLHVDQDLPRSAAYLEAAADLGHALSAGAIGECIHRLEYFLIG
jgi:TPR repeat protein